MDSLLPLAYFGSQEIVIGTWGIVSVITTIFWIVMLVDVVRREFNDSNMKLIWVLVLVFTHSLGALVYYFVGRQMGRLH